MRTLLKTNIVEVANGVLLTIEAPAQPMPDDPLAQRNGFSIGPTYYPDIDAAVANIQSVVSGAFDQIAMREARKALRV